MNKRFDYIELSHELLTQSKILFSAHLEIIFIF